ncbi:TonB-dependent receptor domain-containing protein [Parahaliea aestuarii]|uniref:TonB-dependent receptor n=1 Tax=Parahaliea aestuarii TaxID=1852021 RepID=A0A5C8ZWU7_9GAMM|nr:TonB-dependent receptor [Parahaliea aestuarii]TXS92234.1 TonB-dependent receptor [Parahaliea aestuarii]
MLKKNRLTMAVSAALGMSAAAILPSVANAQDELMVEEVVVTGSRIQKANLVSASPVTQVDAEEFKFQGATRVEDLMKNLPQVYSNQNSSQANGATGTATLNLRNLGDERTLVLVNGRRLPAGSPIQGGSGGADINQIPAALIERVEVLTGGASATYGSDAVAGVVNFIMMDDFEGVKFDYQFSQYQHDNDNDHLQDIVGGAGFPFPDGSATDGDIQDWSLVIGSNLANGRGNVTAYAGYREIDAVFQSQRDYSSCALNTTASGCLGSGTSAEGTFITPAGVFFVDGNQFIPGNKVYNYGPLNSYQRPDERYTGGAFGRFTINEHVETYTELSFMDNQTNAQIAPSGAFGLALNISPDNPFLSDQQRGILFGDLDTLNDDGTAPITVLRRNVEGGPRNQDLRHTTFRGVFGFRGDINETWRYDVYGLYSQVSMENTYYNDLSNTKIANAVDAVIDPETGDTTCASVVDGSDPNCVPWNIWQTGGVDPAAPAYMTLPLFARGTTEQKVFSGYVAGSLGDYGIQLPTADSGVEIVVGAEYRKESLSFNPDEGFQLGLGAGQGGATPAVDGSYDVTEFFTEMSIPVIEGAAFAEEVTLDLGYRYSEYEIEDNSISTDTYGIRAAWALNSDLKLRGSYQRAVRAPNIRELFQPQGFNLFDMVQDPCTTSPDGNPPTATLAQCQRSGVTPEQYGNFVDSFAGQYNFLQGGSTELQPEESDTYSIGIVVTPDVLDGLNVSVDWYSIEIEQGIDNLGPEFILNQCLAGNDALCANVKRGPLGDLWLGSDVNTSGHIVATNDNLAREEVEGFDVSADLTVAVGDMGSLNFSNNMSLITKWDQQEVDVAPVVSCDGVWGGECGYPTPDFRNNLRTTWLTPWDMTFSLMWRHIGGTDDQRGNVDIDSIDYFDLAAVWDVVDSTTLRLGVNNILDEEPPIVGDGAGPSNNGNGGTFPGMYDALGRYMYVGLTVQF